MTDLKLGILLWNQATSWPDMLAAAKKVDELGYEHLWAWDHINAIFGDWDQPIFEGWSVLDAWAMATKRTRLGLLVGANTLRNPGIQAKYAATLDHISDGRAIFGVGGAWFEKEHEAHGIEFGRSPGERLDWLDESVGLMRRLIDGEFVTSEPGGRYAMKDAHQLPVPIQKHLPIMIGGSGEKKTLRTVARYADMWNAMGTPDFLAHKIEVLQGHCNDAGRDIKDIEFTLGVKVTIRDTQAEAERVCHAALAHNKTPLADVADDDTFWNGTPEQLAEQLAPYIQLGFHTVISEQPAPYDHESLERFIGQVKPLAEKLAG